MSVTNSLEEVVVIAEKSEMVIQIEKKVFNVEMILPQS